MIYEVRHVTTYDYAARVHLARCLVHLEPRSLPGQAVLAAELSVDPLPVERARFTDFFGNSAASLRFGEPHARLVLRARARVEVAPPAWPAPGATPPWEAVAAEAAALADLGGSSPVHHLFPSRHVPRLAGATDYVARSFAPRRPVLAAALEAVQRLQADFAYDAGATDVSTPVAEVLAHRRGVCQDFAHLLIAGLRGLGLPAAYVSGYLRTVPPAGQERLAGADASHAWAALWCGSAAGWVGLDPTNGIAAGEGHVVLALGRDYADVAPVSGVVVGGPGQRLAVQVDVVPEGGGAQALAG